MSYFLRRLGFFVLTLWAAITLNFLIPRLQPGDPAQAIINRINGQQHRPPNPEQVHAIRLMLGLPHTGLLQQYGDYLRSVTRLDFGTSYTFFPYSVTHVIGQALPWTLVLSVVTTVVGFIIGTVLGAFAAAKRNSAFDSVVSLGSTFIGTLPFFWVAMLLLYLFAFELSVLPQGGGYSGFLTPGFNSTFILDAAYHSILPAAAILITAPIGWILTMRNNMVQILGADFTRLARAKGLAGKRIVLNYGARNAILPNVTGFALALGTIVAGQLFIEQIFGYPGMGKLLFEAVGDRDYPLMQAIFLFITIGVLVANLIADFLYGVLDPRVRRSGETS
ncbi:MAG: ABC transporter permease [Mycobacterium sp.]|nr:ABC transporter permease [Mycobacterium sp.]